MRLRRGLQRQGEMRTVRATACVLTGTGTDDGGAEVEAVACEVGDPAGLERHEALDEDEEGVCVEGLHTASMACWYIATARGVTHRESNAVRRSPHPRHVQIGPEQSDFAIRADIRLGGGTESGQCAGKARIQTFMPSNTFVLYWKHELAGSREIGPYGLISGSDHPCSGS